MGDTGARRQERYRRHRAGDHSICNPVRCGSVTSPSDASAVTAPGQGDLSVAAKASAEAPELAVPAPPALGGRGRWLWNESTKDGRLPAMQEALLIEACRTADRLDKLAAQLDGADRSWLELEPDRGDDTTYTVVVDEALKEARAQAVALKQLVTELRQSQTAGRVRNHRGGERQAEGAAAKGVAGVADLTDKINARRSAAES